ncbi:retrotransposon gag protein [Cucumis melo var. makuwa]|uniref:Retrotransposon gag protein n=1 Tax=Cucumis melo var. makuwa TaxID=1194695 RepID=A0A5D3BCT4_CUCMM|nr:retrotransposon gag protein [Cucumis melo var. makuwa]TYJ97650.1 retrotransposon gag protein [Cucumis melo var. makuwa]
MLTRDLSSTFVQKRSKNKNKVGSHLEVVSTMIVDVTARVAMVEMERNLLMKAVKERIMKLLP